MQPRHQAKDKYKTANQRRAEKKSTQSADSGEQTTLNRGKEDYAHVKGGAEGTGSWMTWTEAQTDEWWTLVQKYGVYLLA